MLRSILLALCLCFITHAAVAGDWPAWRGPTQMGISNETGMPTEWDQTKNVTWKVPLPDAGNSTPIILGERVIITCAEQKGTVRSTICFDRKDGSQLWKQTITFEEKEQTHGTNPYCSSSPVSDGKCIIVWHGSAGIYCYDMSGKELWKRDLGEFDHIWGNASSPVIHGDHVLLSAGPGLRHVLYCFNKKDGAVVWEKELSDSQSKEAKQFKGSWSTPVIHKIGEMDQMILGLPQKLCGFDPKTGEELWHCKGLSDLVYASPLIGEGVIVAMSGYGGPGLAMKEPSATDRGDLTASHRLWVHPKNPQRVGSGVIVGKHVYILNEPGIAFCIDLKTGEQLWGRGERAGTGGSWSSMVHADGKLWICNMKGETVVLKADPTFEVIAVNPMKEMIRASTAFSDGQVFIRTYGHLYCIGKRREKAAE
ncbi:MAG: PQQ-binding-like beta-propeller repeat protein [Phycisphaeraceae bacterium]